MDITKKRKNTWGKDVGPGLNIQQVEFLAERLPELQKKDPNMSGGVNGVKSLSLTLAYHCIATGDELGGNRFHESG